jgi:hypothetical protein
MSQPYDIEISGDALKCIPRLKDDAGLGRAIAREMEFQNDQVIKQIRTAHLAGPTTDSSLSPRTYRLMTSVRKSPAIITANRVESSIGSNVSYALIHELGYDGPEEVAAHVRRRFTSGKFLIGGKTRHLEHVHTGDINVRAYTRQMHMPARAPFAHGLADRAPEYGEGVSGAIINYWEGRN